MHRHLLLVKLPKYHEHDSRAGDMTDKIGASVQRALPNLQGKTIQ
jgi:hypothetical protein